MATLKTISVSISVDDYEAFSAAARKQNRPIAQLIREAMAEYRATTLSSKTPLTGIPVLAGPRPIEPLPNRAKLYDEVFSKDQDL